MTEGTALDTSRPLKRRRRAVHGVLLIDKPSGITSTAALARAKRALDAEKAGHTGTLDPLASGLLPLCFGEATKFAADLLDADKTYVAVARLGVQTTTGDSEGETIATKPVAVDRARLDEVVARFVGPIDQVPPMYSALKRDGRPLYDYAREGIVVERAARRVVIHALTVVAYAGDTLTIDVRCSKGTYIRTLAEDIGHALGCGAHLIALRRTGAGSLDLSMATPLSILESLPATARDGLLLPIDALIASLPRVDLDADRARRFLDGQRLAAGEASEPGRVRVYRCVPSDDGGVLLGTAFIDADGLLAPTRVVAQATNAPT